MLNLHGMVDRIYRLPSGYGVIGIRPGSLGLLGPRAEILVPTLVLVRDGPPRVGAWLTVRIRELADAVVPALPPDVRWVSVQLVHSGEAGLPADDLDGSGVSASTVLRAFQRWPGRLRPADMYAAANGG